MKRSQGFTLVELLVVIAIITILAAIVVPNVATYMARSQNAKAFADIAGIEIALTAMLTDSGLSNFRFFFVPTAAATGSSIAAAQEFYTNAFYELLLNGRNTSAGWLKESVRRKLGNEYLDLGSDPWSNFYQFYPGPWNATAFPPDTEIPFRRYQVLDPRPGETVADASTLNTVDSNAVPIEIGHPAKGFESMYIYSLGQDNLNSQAVFQGLANDDGKGYDNTLEDEFKGGGDDINNWDRDRSWAIFYR